MHQRFLVAGIQVQGLAQMVLGVRPEGVDHEPPVGLDERRLEGLSALLDKVLACGVQLNPI